MSKDWTRTKGIDSCFSFKEFFCVLQHELENLFLLVTTCCKTILAKDWLIGSKTSSTEIHFHQIWSRCKFPYNITLCTFPEIGRRAFYNGKWAKIGRRSFLLSGVEPYFLRNCPPLHLVKEKSNFGEFQWNWYKTRFQIR